MQESHTHAYTASPPLHPNLILGSLQLLFWLFFHPSAWRNLVARIDPGLRPDFFLAELSLAQWRNPTLRRLLIQENIILPILVSLPISLVMLNLRTPRGDLAFGVAFSVAFAAAFSIAGSVAGSVALGATLGVALGVALSVALGVEPGVTPGVVFGVAIGVAGGVARGVASGQAAYSFARQTGGVIAGVLIGVAMFGLVLGSMFYGAGFGLEFAQQSGLLPDPIEQAVSGAAISVVFGLAGGVVSSVASGLRTRRWRCGLVVGAAGSVIFGAAFAAMFGISFGVIFGAAAGAALGLLTSSFFALLYVLAERLAGPWAGAVAGTLGSGGGWLALVIAWKGSISLWPVLSFGLTGILFGLTLAWWRPILLYPFLAAWNLALLRADSRRAAGPSLLRWHSAFWDEHQYLRLAGLDEHLVMVAERYPAEGRAAMDYVLAGRQRWAAQAAQIELDARRLERCTTMDAISQVHRELGVGELEGPASALLRSFSRISQDVVAALRQESAYNQRLALSAIEDRLDSLVRELTRSSERYAARFHPIAERWRQSVARFARQLAQEAELRQEIDNPYIIGVPLTEQQELFVGRSDACARIEQLLLDKSSPPLLLYGQRRMGKTSLLNNMGRLLPSTIAPLFVDLQGPASQASDHAGLLYNVARGMTDSARRQRGLDLPLLSRQALALDPFTRFDEWLDEVELALGACTALLALDEFEALESAIARERFDEEAVLGMLRHLIQHRSHFKVLLAGSHTLEELQRWASYLINVQVVHIGYLTQDEARQLVERPVRGFALRYEPDASRRVLDLTRGHPFLVQLLCAEIVALKNEQPPAARRLASLADVETAAPEALAHGSFFFADIQRNQIDEMGLALLRTLAAQGEGAAMSREALEWRLARSPDQTLNLLTRRELIETAEGGYRFQVELIRRWFAQAQMPGFV